MAFSSWDDSARADFALLVEGACNLFSRKTIYNEARDELSALGYQEIAISYRDFPTFLFDVSSGLRWQDHFGVPVWGGNLDALDDGLTENFFEESCAVCIEDFDGLVARDAGWARDFLEVFELSSRMHLLFGRRLIGLFQTNDLHYEADGLGGRANWNRRERYRSDRGV